MYASGHRCLMPHHVRRTLTFTNDKGKFERISELDLTAVREPVIVLGEPGMGKTWLLDRIAKLSGGVFRSAASFVSHPNPASLVTAGKKLVIDGLDELSAAQESDPVYRVLGQLIAAGCPPFILSCRAADWRGAVARHDISNDYGVSPREMSLEPFSRDGAIEFLQPNRLFLVTFGTALVILNWLWMCLTTWARSRISNHCHLTARLAASLIPF
jgi:hypothetical protein